MSYDYLDASRQEFERFGLQQIYFPSITNILPEDGHPGQPSWFGVHKKEMSRHWQSWLTMLAHDRGRQRGRLRRAAADGQLRAGRPGRCSVTAR